jgi:hypothetical protein
MRKGSGGIKTALIFLVIAILLILGVYWITQTNLFGSDRKYITEKAGSVSIEKFKKSCKIYSKDDLLSNKKELSGTPIYYHGKILKIEDSVLGDTSVTLYVSGEKYGLDENSVVIFSISNDEDLQANKGDKVKAYGEFESIKEKDGVTTIKVKGVRIIKDE